MKRLVVCIAALLASAFLAGNAASATMTPGSVHTIVRPTGITTTACGSGYYKNVSGVCVHSPSSSATGATARCRDSTYSYSQHASGTCSGHGGVAVWIHHP